MTRERALAGGLWRWVDDAVWDVRYGLRMLRRNPGFALVAVAMLGIGIGINAAVFTIADAVLFKGFPGVAENDRVVYLDTRQNGHGCCLSYPDFLEWRTQTRSFEGLAAVADRQIVLSDEGIDPEHYDATLISANGFMLLRQQPVLGRAFLPADEQPGAAAVAILRYRLWQRRYGGDRAIIGQKILIDGAPATVIGVMPEGFSFPQNLDVWIPLLPTPDLLDRRSGLWLAFGRLADGATIESARAELETIGRRLAAASPSTNQDVVPVVHTFDDFFMGPNAAAIYGSLFGAVGFVLLIACANLASLLLGRAIIRSREISVRMALGAGRMRIVRQIVVESLLLSAAGGLAGWLVATWSLAAYAHAAVPSGEFIGGSWFNDVLDYRMDYRALGYLVAVSIGAGLIFGLAPAVRLSSSRLIDRLKDGGRAAGSIRRTRLSMMLIVLETALALVLLTGAAVTVRSFVRLASTDLGVRTTDVLAMLLRLPDDRYRDAESRTAMYDRLKSRLESLPGVDTVAFTTHAPAGGATMLRYEIGDAAPVDAQHRPTLLSLTVSVGYFRTLGVSVIEGREFDDDDRPGRPDVVVVNQKFVEQQWPGERAIGKRLRLFNGTSPGPWMTVVGVASNVLQGRIARQQIDPLLYLPLRQRPTASVWVLARTDVSPATLTSAFRREVQALDPALPVWLGPFPLAERVAATYAFNGVIGVLFAMFAAVALLLATVGLYAVLAHTVSQRTQEIGIRRALGASTRDVLALVFREGMLPVGAGVALGLAGAVTTMPVLQSILVRISPADPTALTAASALLIMSAALGCAMPARRALRIHPAAALRHE